MPPLSSPIKVAIVEDHQKIREGLTALIDGTKASARPAVFDPWKRLWPGSDRTYRTWPGIGLPGISGIEGVRVLKQRYPHLRF
jgi:DNA-binding NarL/FixJ family response regulator